MKKLDERMVLVMTDEGLQFLVNVIDDKQLRAKYDNAQIAQCIAHMVKGSDTVPETNDTDIDEYLSQFDASVILNEATADVTLSVLMFALDMRVIRLKTGMALRARLPQGTAIQRTTEFHRLRHDTQAMNDIVKVIEFFCRYVDLKVRTMTKSEREQHKNDNIDIQSLDDLIRAAADRYR